MSTHTKGPWRAVTGQGAHFRDWYIRCDKGRTSVCAGRAVAKTCSTGIQAPEANARLISAAPDLLEACKLMEHHLSMADKTIGVTRCLSILRAAIAKAEGKQP